MGQYVRESEGTDSHMGRVFFRRAGSLLHFREKSRGVRCGRCIRGAGRESGREIIGTVFYTEEPNLGSNKTWLAQTIESMKIWGS